VTLECSRLWAKFPQPAPLTLPEGP
jgi:hypothetical protein